MKMLLRLFLVANLALLVACGGSDGGGGTPEPVEPEITIEVDEAPVNNDSSENEVTVIVVPSPTTSSIMIDNRTTVDIMHFYISPSANSGWGADYFAARGALATPGLAYRVTDLPCGVFYDLKAETYGNNVVATKYNLFLYCSSSYTWEVRS